MEAKEYHNIPPDLVGFVQGYHDFSYDIVDYSLTLEEGSFFQNYTVTIDVTNMNSVDLDVFYLESLLYATNGLIADYTNKFSEGLFKVGETIEFTLSYLLQTGEDVAGVDFWGLGYQSDKSP